MFSQRTRYTRRLSQAEPCSAMLLAAVRMPCSVIAMRGGVRS